VLRRIFRPKREEVTRNRRKTHLEKFSMNCALHQTSWRMIWKRYVGCMGGMRNAYNILVGKPEWKKTPGSPRRR